MIVRWQLHFEIYAADPQQHPWCNVNARYRCPLSYCSPSPRLGLAREAQVYKAVAPLLYL
jgi:hypothetical protein